MVLWEITLGTAYFLGLKRTYKLALKIQRRIVGPKRPKTRQFLQGKTRSIFDAALNVHRKVQQRDIEVGRNFGNWILRWLDKRKPGAQIRARSPAQSQNHPVKSSKQQLTKSSNQKPSQSYGTSYMKNKDHESGKRQFSSGSVAAYPNITMMMRPTDSVGTQYSRVNTFVLKGSRFDGVLRNDIMQWMMQK